MKTLTITPLATRNLAVKRAYFNLVMGVKRLISEQRDEYHRYMVEIDHSGNMKGWTLHELVTPQFYLLLEQDPMKHYWIHFAANQNMERSLNVNFFRLVFDHTRQRGDARFDDILKLDHIFLNTEELFNDASMNQPIENIHILEEKRFASH